MSAPSAEAVTHRRSVLLEILEEWRPALLLPGVWRADLRLCLRRGSGCGGGGCRGEWAGGWETRKDQGCELQKQQRASFAQQRFRQMQKEKRGGRTGAVLLLSLVASLQIPFGHFGI